MFPATNVEKRPFKNSSCVKNNQIMHLYKSFLIHELVMDHDKLKYLISGHGLFLMH